MGIQDWWPLLPSMLHVDEPLTDSEDSQGQLGVPSM